VLRTHDDRLRAVGEVDHPVDALFQSEMTSMALLGLHGLEVNRIQVSFVATNISKVVLSSLALDGAENSAATGVNRLDIR